MLPDNFMKHASRELHEMVESLVRTFPMACAAADLVYYFVLHTLLILFDLCFVLSPAVALASDWHSGLMSVLRTVLIACHATLGSLGTRHSESLGLDVQTQTVVY